jgi:hypothetical protein
MPLTWRKKLLLSQLFNASAAALRAKMSAFDLQNTAASSRCSAQWIFQSS